MKRLLVATFLALLLHGALLWWGPRWRGTQGPLTTRPLPPLIVEMPLTPADLSPPAPAPPESQAKPGRQAQSPLPLPTPVKKLNPQPQESAEPKPPPAQLSSSPPSPAKLKPRPVDRSRPRPEPAVPASIPAQPPAAAPAEPIAASATLSPADAGQPTAAAPPAPTPPTVADRPDSAPLQEAYPLYRLNPPPPYPPASRQRNEQGTVLLAVLVAANGRVVTAEVAESSGHPRLDRAALSAVREWLFEPGQRGQEKITMQVMVPIRFDLR